MIKKIKEKKYIILEIILIFIITLLYNLICIEFSRDEIWNYGFSYNISNGLIPYKDFNLVITPLYPLLGALFLTIFGRNMLVYHIFNALICTNIFYFIKKQTPKHYLIISILLLSQSYPSYNLFCILLLYIIMSMEDKKANDYIIGILLGLTFITKQNIGVFLCLPTIFIKDIKKIIKRIAGFLIPILLLGIYLIMTNSIYEFIDYTFLGLNSFANNNLVLNKSCLIMILITVIYLIYKYFKTKDIKIIYLLSFQLLVLPMIEPYHVLIALIPSWGYAIKDLKKFSNITKLTSFIFIIAIFSVNIHKIYINEYSFPNISQTYKYRNVLTIGIKQTTNIANYIRDIDDEVYVIDRNAYLIKLEANKKINKYDLLNAGNLGTKGEQGLIEEIKETCSNKKCTFLVDTIEMTPNLKYVYAHNIITYIQTNYYCKENIEYLLVFKNY